MQLEDPLTEGVDDQTVSEYLESGCSCSYWNGENGVKHFSVGHLQQIIMQCQELTRSELDLVILCQLQVFMNHSNLVSVEFLHKPTSHARPYFAYHYQGKQICLKTFLFCHGKHLQKFSNSMSPC